MTILAPILEYSIMSSVLDKEIDYNEVPRKTLSHIGQILHQSIEKLLLESGNWDKKGVLIVATEVLGLDRSLLSEYLANMEKYETDNAKDIHVLLRERNALIEVSNEVQRQLHEGDLDLGKIQVLSLKSARKSNDLTSVAQDLGHGVPDPPGGPKILTLPEISKAINGLHGMVLIGGLPKIGKSTLAFQIAIDISREMPVLYYDFENTKNVMLYRLVESRGIDFAQKVKRLYIRDSIRSLGRDLLEVKAPAVIVIDSIQRVWSKVSDDKRAGLDAWIRRFEELKQEGGYKILFVSEVSRQHYSGIPRLDAFKETGSLEYAADSAFVLTEAPPFVKVWVVANRHYPTVGQLCLLERVSPFWFKEQTLSPTVWVEGNNNV